MIANPRPGSWAASPASTGAAFATNPAGKAPLKQQSSSTTLVPARQFSSCSLTNAEDTAVVASRSWRLLLVTKWSLFRSSVIPWPVK